ncbi:MAG: hisH [Caulobacteraceae bacterium]|jgi:glutamine amidotransferase|nr:hisH [Caulobacteraceae bacterium]
MQTVALIDYGSGNLPSAEKALRKAAASLSAPTAVVVTDDPEVIARADRVVLPGVGAFAACMSALEARPGVIEAMGEAAAGRGAPFLGICVGMQLLATRGREFGYTNGLNWIEGDVRRLEPTDRNLKIPHMGWNGLDTTLGGDLGGPLFAGLNSGVHMYFTHSYVLVPERETDVAAWTDHGGAFAAAVVRGNIAGVQFHPEKSQGAGARLLGNFLNWRP